MSETLEEIAHKIVRRYLDDYTNDHQLEQQIISALRNEREACAKIADSAFPEYQTGHNAGKWIARAIREGQ